MRRAGTTLPCGARASHCSGFSCWGAQALGTRASVVVARGFGSCGLRTPERRLSSCGAQAQLLRSMWDLPGPGLESLSPALAGGFLTTAPPRKSREKVPFKHRFPLAGVDQAGGHSCGPLRTSHLSGLDLQLFGSKDGSQHLCLSPVASGCHSVGCLAAK